MSTLQLIGVHYRVAEPGWAYPDHHHKIFELLYCYDGNSHQYVEGSSIAFGKGDWLIIPPALRHYVVNSGLSNYIYLSFHFDIDDLKFRD
jgi:quercetin dioxygenase-like cupin family protein